MYTKNKPLVSVIMPVYNAEKYIETAISSILNQTYNNFEFIIINDASTDNSLKLIQKLKDKRIILIGNNKNLGVTKSLNKGLDLANGKYVVRMDADDWSYPTRIEKQVKLMELHPNAVVCGAFIQICDADLNVQYLRRYKLDDKSIRERMFRYSPFAHPVTIWRMRELKLERYDEKATNVEDYELYFRIGKLGSFRNIEEPLLKLRMHSRSISYSMNNHQSDATIQIRWNAVQKYGYKMSLFDKIYNFLQATVVRQIPIKFRFWLFNFLRQFEAY